MRRTLLGLLAIVAAVLALSSPSGQVAAAQFLSQFRSQKLAVVMIDPSQARMRLPELDAIGTVEGQARQRPQRVATVAEAAQRLGGPLHQPDPATFPADIDPNPRISVTSGSHVRYTFNRDRARAYFESVGRPEASLPEKLHGASLSVAIPAIVVLDYAAAAIDSPDAMTQSSTSRERPASVSNRLGIMFAQSGELSVDAAGASLEEMRDYLLTLPGLTESTARQLRAIHDWRTTLPIPVPIDAVKWQSVSVSGNPGYLLIEQGGLGSAVIWNANGRIHGLMGGLGAAEMQRIAASVN